LSSYASAPCIETASGAGDANGVARSKGTIPVAQVDGMSRASSSNPRSAFTTQFAQAADPTDAAFGSTPAIPATSQ
jgi:hypothetical protein